MVGSFSSKLGILKALVDVTIAGDDEPTDLPSRPSVRQALELPEPRDRLAQFARLATEINARTAGVYRVLVSAADADPGAAMLLAELDRQRRRGQGLVVRDLVRDGTLRTELTSRRAGDLVHALLSPELFRLLVVEAGWSVGRYETWLADLLADQLLGPSAASPVEAPPAD